MDLSLDLAIDGLYAAFALYGRPDRFSACSCCFNSGSRETLYGRQQVSVLTPGGSRPVRELAIQELNPITESVPLTSGTLELLKHYLPRILELESRREPLGLGLAWAMSRLNDDAELNSEPWTAWPETEQSALRAFFRALWIHCLTEVGSQDDPYRSGEALCAIGTVEPNIDWYLERWLRFDHPEASANLLRFLGLNLPELVADSLFDTYWDSREPAPTNRLRVIDWLRAPATAAKVFDAVQHARSDAERAALEDCYLLLADR